VDHKGRLFCWAWETKFSSVGGKARIQIYLQQPDRQPNVALAQCCWPPPDLIVLWTGWAGNHLRQPSINESKLPRTSRIIEGSVWSLDPDGKAEFKRRRGAGTGDAELDSGFGGHGLPRKHFLATGLRGCCAVAGPDSRRADRSPAATSSPPAPVQLSAGQPGRAERPPRGKFEPARGSP
jgi:hypothetical protein